jgi:protein-S-isoprenylcysteine O-methyltransferase Ste14
VITKMMPRDQRASLVWSAGFRVARVFVFGVFSWFSFFAAHPSPWRTGSLLVVLAVAAIIGLTWFLSRVLADRRWRAALDHYAEHEIAKSSSARRINRKGQLT